MIYGVGETVLDILFRSDQPQKAVPGGSTFNAMISLARRGVPAAMITETGGDHVGELTLGYMQDNGLDTRYVVRHEGMKSHVSLAFLDENSDAHYSFYKDHNAWSVQPLLQAARSIVFASSDALLLGSFFAINPLLREVVATLLHAAHEAGAMIYYDVNFRQPHASELDTVRPFIEENMRLSTVTRGSMDDMRIVYGADAAREGVSITPAWVYSRVKSFCPYLIITDGAQPIHVFTPEAETTIVNSPLSPVSTVGAGDNFNAGFLCSYMNQALSAVPASWTPAAWSAMLASAQSFSREVCLSWDNSVAR